MKRTLPFSLTLVFHLTCSVLVASPAPSPVPASEFDSPALSPVAPADPPGTEFIPTFGIFDVTEHGAVPDGWTESSAAFSAAWDAACNHTGNSTFYVPEGTYLVGPVTFSGPCFNNESPDIKIAGTLIAPTSLTAFPHSSWIVFQNLKEIRLTGATKTPGKLDGQGAVEAWNQISCRKSMRCDQLVTSLKFSNVSKGTISNISLSNSKGFHIGFHGSDNINVHNVNITAPSDSPNTDGIHVSYSSNINITSSSIGVGDDCVSIGPGSVNISVSDTHCGPGHGISVGSLGKYPNEEDVVGISVYNCTISGTQNGVRVKSWPGAPPSHASDMVFANITMINVSNPIVIDQDYCPSNSCNRTNPSFLELKNITFRQISGTYNTKSAVTLLCSNEASCEDIQFVDINLKFTQPESPPQGRFNANGVIHHLLVNNSSF